MAIRKSTIAQEARRQLAFMGEMLHEDNWNGNAVIFHANSANNYIAAIEAVPGIGLPNFIERVGRPFLRVHGWKV